MLILSRYQNEEIVITTPSGDRIRVCVVSSGDRKTKARIGIEAPQDYTVNRKEVQNAIDHDVPQRRGRLSARVAETITVHTQNDVYPAQAAQRAILAEYPDKPLGKWSVTVWDAVEGSGGPVYQFEVERHVRVSVRPIPRATAGPGVNHG